MKKWNRMFNISMGLLIGLLVLQLSLLILSCEKQELTLTNNVSINGNSYQLDNTLIIKVNRQKNDYRVCLHSSGIDISDYFNIKGTGNIIEFVVYSYSDSILSDGSYQINSSGYMFGYDSELNTSIEESSATGILNIEQSNNSIEIHFEGKNKILQDITLDYKGSKSYFEIK